ncbi:divalent-cation tolerance protein CutA [Helicobacter himalayensis]|uniref:divalent-cation tolerance protein CutA n=1 Tax=Helicobacter himalayensis TaxID=1591088 RepID=UPI000830D44A|nr:divalent-cation tolerance protein CutA [Helicobacter himalayensis]
MLCCTTLDNKKQARKIIKKLLGKNLIACAQIQKISSLYRWEGRLCDDKEFLLTLKTHPKKRKKLCKILTKLHPYKVPEIACVRVDSWGETYEKWLLKQCRL